MCVSMGFHINIHTHTSIQILTCTHTYTFWFSFCFHSFIYIFIYVYVCACAHARVCVCVCVKERERERERWWWWWCAYVPKLVCMFACVKGKRLVKSGICSAMSASAEMLAELHSAIVGDWPSECSNSAHLHLFLVIEMDERRLHWGRIMNGFQLVLLPTDR